MCDFSAQAAKKREAVKGDKLVVAKISSHTTGFVDINDQSMAVCILPGAELAFGKSVRAQKVLHSSTLVGMIKAAFRPKAEVVEAKNVATFVQVNKDDPNTHHDALLFVDSAVILLNELEHGQTATVLTMPVDPSTLHGKAREAAEDDQRRATYV